MPKRLRRVAAFSLVLAFMLIGLSCSQSEKTPAPSATYAPTPAIDSGEFSLAVISSYYSANAVGRLQELLNKRGWNVRLVLKSVESTNSDESEEYSIVSADAASGTPCDGYFVSTGEARRLLQAGLTKDMSAVFPEAAPLLYERYRQVFQGELPGIPVYVQFYPKGFPTVFYLRKDIADQWGKRIDTIGDILSLLKTLDTGGDMQKISVEVHNLGGMWYGMLDVWAGEMGDYPLSEYGMSGLLYASFTDGQCTPIPIETIKGFKEFADSCHEFISAGRIVDVFEMQESSDDSIVGFIGPVSAFINPVYLINNHRSGSDYLAFPLAGCRCPRLPGNDPIVGFDIAVSAASGKGAEIAKFIQWAAFGPDNYDLLNYGQEGLDYRIHDDRLELLLQGKALSSADIQSKSVFFNGKPFLFHDDSIARKLVYSPVNFDELTALEPITPPIWSIAELRRQPNECKSVFQDIDDKMAQTLQARSDFIYGMIDEKFSNGKERSQCLPGLLAMKDDTNKLVDAYAVRIKELLEQQGKGS